MAGATRTSLPMYFPPSSFVLADVVTCANLVAVAYDQYCQWEAQGKPRHWRDFTWTPAWPTGFTAEWVSLPLWGDAKEIFFADPEPFGFVVQDASRRGFLVFRGTESDADWYKDIEVKQVRYSLVKAPDFGKAHDGFFGIYASMSPGVLVAVNQIAATSTRFFFTGHSLGSAVVTLAVPDVMTNSGLSASAATVLHYNFASPRAGDAAFAGALDAMPRLTTFRIVNTEDLVPDVPLAVTSDLFDTYDYKHVGTPVDFTAQYDSISGNHSMLNSYLYAVTHPSQPEGPIVAPAPCQPKPPAGLRRKTPTPPTSAP
ncbi:MAG: lipase family protein [Gammaproteobacteria bacterium]